MADVNTILSRLISSLTVSDPSWDVGVGSATYKILESVANEIAITSNSSTLQTYSFDVNSKSGTELDAFVNLFGITRQLGKRAVGTVTFTLASPATTVISIPNGTQVYVPGTTSTTGNSIYFDTSTSASIAVGQTEVEVPVISSLPGTFNNVAAQTITAVLTPIVGLPTVTNYQPLANGIDTETDAQLQARWTATAFSNISGTTDKFTAVALQDPNVTQVNIVGAQQIYNEQLQVTTVVSGNSNFRLGLNFQATLTAISGALTALLTGGSFPSNTTVNSGFYVAVPSGAYSGSIYYDGTNYNLSNALTASGGATLTVNFTASGTTVLSGSSTAANVQTAVNSLFSAIPLAGVTSTTTGTTISGTGISIQLNQPTGYNVVVSSGTISGTNYVTSQIPDSKYTYPEGGEALGLNIGSYNQYLLQNNTDYIYPTSSGVPLKIQLVPNVGNAPYTYTGNLLELQSEYIPTSSRITNPTVNSNYIDMFINATTANSTTEQIIFQPTVRFNTISGNSLNVNNFNFSSGQNAALNSPISTASGDYYIGFSNQPLTNFPAQLVSGNAPSFITFGTSTNGNVTIPIALEYVNNGSPPIITGISGAAGNNYLTTNTSISGLLTGLAISGTGIGTTSTLSGVPFGSYITQLTPGTPNYIYLNNTLTSDVTTASGTFVTVGYPVYDNTNNAGSVLDATGIGIDYYEQVGYSTLGIPPFTNSPVSMVGTISSTYNADVVQVNDLIQQTRVIGTNVLVRQAQYLNLIVSLSVVYDNNVNITAVNNTIQTLVSQYLQSVPYTGTITPSNIANTVVGIFGVRAARISTSTDNPTYYGIQEVALDGTNIGTPYTSNILLANNQLASLYGIYITTFGDTNF